MNRKTKNSFDRIQGAVSSYQTSVQEALFRFRQADAMAKEDSKQYVDAEGRYQARRDELVSAARQNIESAKELFSKTVRAEIGELRTELSSHTMNRPSPALLDNLRTFRDFNLQPTRTDISALLEMAQGNTLGIRAINSVLEATKSPLRINAPTIEDFERDLSALEKMASGNAWTPIDYHTTACAIYRDQPRPNTPGYTWDNLSLLIARADFESNVKSLDNMSTRWVDDITPSIEQVKNYERNADGSAAEQYLSDRAATGASARVEPSESTAVEQAAAMARQRAEADANAREVLSMFAV